MRRGVVGRIAAVLLAVAGVSVLRSTQANQSHERDLPLPVISLADGQELPYPEELGGYGRLNGLVPLGLRDGFLATDAFEARLFVIDAAAHSISQVGRRGSGPGEYLSVSGAWPYRGDSVIVSDGQGPRATILDPHGRAARVINLRSSTGRLVLLGAYPDGSLLVATNPSYRTDSITPVGALAESLSIFIANPAGSPIRNLGRYLAGWSFVERTEHSVTVSAIPFTPRTLFSTRHDTLLWISGPKSTLWATTLDGLRRPVAQWPSVSRIVSDRQRRSLIARVSEGVVDTSLLRIIDAASTAVESPQTLPVAMRLLTAPRGGTLIQEYFALGDSVTSWILLKEDYQPVMRMTIAGESRALLIHRDQIYVVRVDEVGLERLWRFALPELLSEERR